MSFTPPDEETIYDIVLAATAIREYMRGVDRERFDNEPMRRDAVERQIMIIGEATKRLSPAFRVAHPEIPWRAIAGMRDVLVHDYDEIVGDRVWRAATEHAPRLLASLEPLLPPEP